MRTYSVPALQRMTITPSADASVAGSGEHRLFSFITQNWRGKPLITHQVIVNLLAATTTTTGLRVRCRLDDHVYAKGRRVTDTQLATVHLEPHAFHGEWNYTIHPATTLNVID